MSILCKIFGHTFRPNRYGSVRRYAIDNIGREHATVFAECDRCDEKFDLCHIHLPERAAETKVRERLTEAERLLSFGTGENI